MNDSAQRKRSVIARLRLRWDLIRLQLRQRLTRFVVGSRVEAFLVDTKQGLFLVDPEDMGVGNSLIKTGAYGEDEIQRICSLVDEKSSVLFVGTHVGALAIPVSRHVKRVVGIEANPATFALLEKNIGLNNCANFHAIQLAASDEKGELEFLLNRTNSGGSKRMPRVRAYKYFYDKPHVVKVKADKLDVAAFADYTVIVMDIEGSEYYALRGMPMILSRASHLIMEYLPHHLKNVANVSVGEMLALIEPWFDVLTIPSKGLVICKSQFLSVLEEMYHLYEGDDGLIFSKSAHFTATRDPDGHI